MVTNDRLVLLPRLRGTQFDLNNIGVGDRIVVERTSYYRIEQLSVKVDEYE